MLDIITLYMCIVHCYLYIIMVYHFGKVYGRAMSSLSLFVQRGVPDISQLYFTMAFHCPAYLTYCFTFVGVIYCNLGFLMLRLSFIKLLFSFFPQHMSGTI